MQNITKRAYNFEMYFSNHYYTTHGLPNELCQYLESFNCSLLHVLEVSIPLGDACTRCAGEISLINICTKDET